VAILLGVAGSAWLISARLATPDMRLGVLTGAALMSARGQMGMPGSTSMSMSMGLSAFIATWTVMMVAMMVPSTIPAVKTFDTWTRATRQPGSTAVLFITGYVLVWSTSGGVAYLVVQAIQGWLPAGSMSALRIGAVLLVVAGVYQLTPTKQACLRHCRSPHTVVAPQVSTRVQGHLGAVRAGLVLQRHLGALWGVIVMKYALCQSVCPAAEMAALGTRLVPPPPVRPRQAEAPAPVRVARRAQQPAHLGRGQRDEVLLTRTAPFFAPSVRSGAVGAAAARVTSR